jgi:hypothetical protein
MPRKPLPPLTHPNGSLWMVCRCFIATAWTQARRLMHGARPRISDLCHLPGAHRSAFRTALSHIRARSAGEGLARTRPAWACDAVTALILSDPEVIEAHIAGEPLATQTGRQLSRDPSHDSRVVVGQWWPRY